MTNGYHGYCCGTPTMDAPTKSFVVFPFVIFSFIFSSSRLNFHLHKQTMFLLFIKKSDHHSASHKVKGDVDGLPKSTCQMIFFWQLGFILGGQIVIFFQMPNT